MGERKELPADRGAIERNYLDTDVISDSGTVVGRLFSIMKRNHIDFSHAALAFLERKKHTRTSLFYLTFNVQDEKVLKRLAEVELNSEFEHDRKQAMELIRKR